MYYWKSKNKMCSHKSNSLGNICAPKITLQMVFLLNKFLTIDDRLIVAIYPTDKPVKYPRDILNLFHKSQKEIKEPEEVNESETFPSHQ